MEKVKEIDIFNAFNHKPEPLDYVLPGMLAGTIGALVSPGGLGKSFFALQVAAQIAGGSDVIGLGNLKNGPVLYLPAEDPIDSLVHRVHYLGGLLSKKEQELVKENLCIRSFLGYPVDILDKKSFEYIKDLSHGKRLVIIDTLRRFHREDENSSGAMASVIGQMESICHDTGCSILFLHHCNKSSTVSGAQSSRGSSVLVDNIRWQGQLVSITTKELESLMLKKHVFNSVVKFMITKQNYGKSCPDKFLARLENGFLTDINNTGAKFKTFSVF